MMSWLYSNIHLFKISAWTWHYFVSIVCAHVPGFDLPRTWGKRYCVYFCIIITRFATCQKKKKHTQAFCPLFPYSQIIFDKVSQLSRRLLWRRHRKTCISHSQGTCWNQWSHAYSEVGITKTQLKHRHCLPAVHQSIFFMAIF